MSESTYSYPTLSQIANILRSKELDPLCLPPEKVLVHNSLGSLLKYISNTFEKSYSQHATYQELLESINGSWIATPSGSFYQLNETNYGLFLKYERLPLYSISIDGRKMFVCSNTAISNLENFFMDEKTIFPFKFLVHKVVKEMLSSKGQLTTQEIAFRLIKGKYRGRCGLVSFIVDDTKERVRIILQSSPFIHFEDNKVTSINFNTGNDSDDSLSQKIYEVIQQFDPFTNGLEMFQVSSLLNQKGILADKDSINEAISNDKRLFKYFKLIGIRPDLPFEVQKVDHVHSDHPYMGHLVFNLLANSKEPLSFDNIFHQLGDQLYFRDKDFMHVNEQSREEIQEVLDFAPYVLCDENDNYYLIPIHGEVDLLGALYENAYNLYVQKSKSASSFNHKSIKRILRFQTSETTVEFLSDISDAKIKSLTTFEVKRMLLHDIEVNVKDKRRKSKVKKLKPKQTLATESDTRPKPKAEEEKGIKRGKPNEYNYKHIAHRLKSDVNAKYAFTIKDKRKKAGFTLVKLPNYTNSENLIATAMRDHCGIERNDSNRSYSVIDVVHYLEDEVISDENVEVTVSKDDSQLVKAIRIISKLMNNPGKFEQVYKNKYVVNKPRKFRKDVPIFPGFAEMMKWATTKMHERDGSTEPMYTADQIYEEMKGLRYERRGTHYLDDLNLIDARAGMQSVSMNDRLGFVQSKTGLIGLKEFCPNWENIEIRSYDPNAWRKPVEHRPKVNKSKESDGKSKKAEETIEQEDDVAPAIDLSDRIMSRRQIKSKQLKTDNSSKKADKVKEPSKEETPKKTKKKEVAESPKTPKKPPRIAKISVLRKPQFIDEKSSLESTPTKENKKVVKSPKTPKAPKTPKRTQSSELALAMIAEKGNLSKESKKKKQIILDDSDDDSSVIMTSSIPIKSSDSEPESLSDSEQDIEWDPPNVYYDTIISEPLERTRPKPKTKVVLTTSFEPYAPDEQVDTLETSIRRIIQQKGFSNSDPMTSIYPALYKKFGEGKSNEKFTQLFLETYGMVKTT